MRPPPTRSSTVGRCLSSVIQLGVRAVLAQVFNRLVTEFDKPVLQQARFDTMKLAGLEAHDCMSVQAQLVNGLGCNGLKVLFNEVGVGLNHFVDHLQGCVLVGRAQLKPLRQFICNIGREMALVW